MWKSIGLSITLMVCAGCGDRQAKEITETRTVEAPPASSTGHAGGAMSQLDPSMLPPGHPKMSTYRWELPEGWSEAPLTPMREGNFKLAADPNVECYITVLQGAAGGAEANINRWRLQMGQPEWTADEIAALPKVDMLGSPSPLVEIPGTFTGMTGTGRENYLLLGAICTLADSSLFVKMTGPEAVVRAEKERFTTFCQSIKEGKAAIEAGAQENE